MDHSRTAPVAALVRTPSAEDVRHLAEVAGLDLSPDRLPVVAVHLAELLALAADLRTIDLDGVEPETRFDPRWPDGEST